MWVLGVSLGTINYIGHVLGMILLDDTVDVGTDHGHIDHYIYIPC